MNVQVKETDHNHETLEVRRRIIAKKSKRMSRIRKNKKHLKRNINKQTITSSQKDSLEQKEKESHVEVKLENFD